MFITMNAFVGFVIACLALSSNGLPTSLIIGGENAPISLYPYQVSLRFEDTHCCNGAIISRRYVITVAQCIYGNTNPFRFTVAVGSDRLDKPGVVYQVKAIIIHDGYNKARHAHDIGLVLTDQDIQFNANIQPIALPNVNRDYEDYPLIVTGWAKNNVSFYPYSLQEILVQGYPQNQCNDEYGFIQEGQICTQCTEDGQGLCDGDFGDPVVANGILVGLVSHIRCDYLYPDIATRIFHYRSWINRHMVDE